MRSTDREKLSWVNPQMSESIKYRVTANFLTIFSSHAPHCLQWEQISYLAAYGDLIQFSEWGVDIQYNVLVFNVY